jgi:hypothetical protein
MSVKPSRARDVENVAHWVSQRGVAGGGLTHGADRSSFCRWPWLPRAIALLDVIIKLSPVKVTTLGGAFCVYTMTLIARAVCPVTNTIALVSPGGLSGRLFSVLAPRQQLRTLRRQLTWPIGLAHRAIGTAWP